MNRGGMEKGKKMLQALSGEKRQEKGRDRFATGAVPFLLSFIFLFALIPAPAFSSEEVKGSAVVATVNGSPLVRSDVVLEVNSLLPQELYHRNITEEKRREIEKKALENLINGELIYLEGKKQGIRPDRSEVRKRLKQFQATYPSKKAFEESMRTNGFSMGYLEAKIGKLLVIEELVKKEVKVFLSDRDMEEYYQKNEEKFREPESVRLRYLYVQFNPSEADWKKKAKAKAREAYEKLRAGADFAAVAQVYSSDRSRVKGGDVGFVHKGTMPAEVEKAAFSLKGGQMSEMIEDDTGYHVLKVEERRPSRQVPLQEIRDKLRKELTESMQKGRMDALVARLRATARIEYVK